MTTDDTPNDRLVAQLPDDLELTPPEDYEYSFEEFQSLFAGIDVSRDEFEQVTEDDEFMTLVYLHDQLYQLEVATDSLDDELNRIYHAVGELVYQRGFNLRKAAQGDADE